MDNRIINNMIDKNEAVKNEERYNASDIYIGLLERRSVSKNGKLGMSKIINPNLHIFKYISIEYFKDIENNKYYPLMPLGERGNSGEYYIPEYWLYKLTKDFQTYLENNNIDANANLTIGEIKDIIEILQHNRDKMF